MRIDLSYSGIDFYISVTESTYDAYKLGKNTTEGSKNFGSITESNLGYFTSFGKAISKIIQSGMSSVEETVSLEEFVKRYEKVYSELIKLANED